MPQQTGSLLTYFFAVLGIVFFLMGMYFGLKNYNKILTGAETGLRYSILGVGSFFLAGFISLTMKTGFSERTLCLLILGAGFISFLLYVNVLIRKETVRFLRKRNVLSPFAELARLFRLLINGKETDNNTDDVDDKK